MMKALQTAFIFIYVVTCASTLIYTKFTSKLHGVVFRYYGETYSERALPICEKKGSVCSVLHKRYWSTPLITRFCRCASGFDCPWTWSELPDNQSMSLDNYSQLKFCEPVTRMKECQEKQPAIFVHSYKMHEHFLNHPPEIYATCYCPPPNYWRQSSKIKRFSRHNSTVQVTNIYQCNRLNRCSSGEFCGNARTDFNFIYYRCSCPRGHLCIYTDKRIFNVEELLYTGPAYRATCYANKVNYGDDYDY